MTVQFNSQSADATPKTGDEWTSVSRHSDSLSRKDRKRIARLNVTQTEFLQKKAVEGKITGQTPSSQPKEAQQSRKVEKGGINSSQTTSAASSALFPDYSLSFPPLVPESGGNSKSCRERK